LKVGDFVLSGRVVVETKTVNDLAASIIDGRLFDQLAAMTDLYGRSVLLVEGDSPYASATLASKR